MPFVRREHEGDILIISMNRPKANALNAGLVQSLRESFAIARGQKDIRAIVLTSGCPGFFSVGLDLREIDSYDRNTMRSFWNDFRELYEEIHELSKPTVAALTGHTVAGGIILALACDVRIMARADVTLAVSGINMGLSLGGRVYAMAVQAVGHAHARDLFLTGESISPERAEQLGLVRELTAPGELLDRARAVARALGAKSPRAYNEIKVMARNAAGYSHAEPPDADAFIDRWFSEETKSIRTAAIENLSRER